MVLHKFKDQIEKVIFADTGSVYPHCVEFVEKTCAKYRLKLIKVRSPVNVKDWTDAMGLPSDTIIHKAPNPKNGIGLQTIEQCCGEMIWKPMQEYLITTGAKTVLRGQKATDHHLSIIGHEYFWSGIRYLNPIWDWTDDQVFDYIKEHGLEMAEHYYEINESLDCWNCTAHLSHHGAEKRLEYTKKKYPKLWDKLSDKLSEVKRALDSDRKILKKSFDMVPMFTGVKQHIEYAKKEKANGN